MNSVLVITSFLLVLSPLTSAVLTKVTCSTSDKGTCANLYCNLTPGGKVSFGCENITVPVNEIIISQDVSVKVLQAYVPLNIFPDIDFCAYVRNSGILGLSLNTFFSVFVGSLEKQNPGIYHQCPYQGKDFQVKSFGLGAVETFLGYLVTEYRIDYHVKNSNDDNIYSISMIGDARANALLGINLGINLF